MLNLRIQLMQHVTKELVFANGVELSYSRNLYTIYRDQMSRAFLALLIANSEVPDERNNIGRLCSISGDKTNRENLVVMPLHNGYILWNQRTDEMRLGSLWMSGPFNRMSNLY